MEDDQERLDTLDRLLTTIASRGTANDKANSVCEGNSVNIPYEIFSTSKLNKGISDIDVVISGGGLRGYYVTGASVILHKVLKENNIRIARYAGTSCGAWCAAFMAMGLSTSTWTKTYILSKEYCTKHKHKTIHEAYRECVIPWLYETKAIPSDAYKKCSNRCFISITRLTPLPKNAIISSFLSNEDLLECLLASSSIPYFTEPNFTGFYRGYRVVDGGITNNCPIFNDAVDRYQLVVRLSDVPITFTNMVSANDNCIESIILRGALQMKQFFSGQGPWKSSNGRRVGNEMNRGDASSFDATNNLVRKNKYELQREIEFFKSKQNTAQIFHWYLKSSHDRLNKKMRLQQEFEEDMNMHEDWGCFRSNISFVKVIFRENHLTRFVVVVVWLILFTLHKNCCELKCCCKRKKGDNLNCNPDQGNKNE